MIQVDGVMYSADEVEAAIKERDILKFRLEVVRKALGGVDGQGHFNQTGVYRACPECGHSTDHFKGCSIELALSGTR